MTRVWWVRHGPTHEKAFVGWRDVPADLSDKSAIARTAAYLPDTALREFNFGVWDGMTFDAVAARDPVDSRLFWEEPGARKAPQGESWNDVSARVGKAVDALIAQNAAQDLVLVAHIGVIMTQIQRATGGSAYSAMSHQIANFSVTDMAFDGTGWTLGTINHIA